MRVAELWAAFSIRPSKDSLRNTQRAIASVRSMVMGLGVAFGATGLVKHMVRLNMETDQVRTQIAGMLALSRGTNLSDEMGAAADSVARLRERAAGLPGSFREYAQFMGRIVQQSAKAGLGIQQIEDLTVGAVVASKALNVQWATGARDIDQFLQGRWSIRDELTTKLMTAIGEEDRKKVNAMSRADRAALLRQAFQSKQITQLASAQASTVSGKLEKLKDQFDLFMMRVGGPLFGALGDALGAVNSWLEKNKQKLIEVANTIGRYVSGAFAVLRKVIAFLVEDSDRVLAVLGSVVALLGAMAVRSIAAFAPVLATVAVLAGAIYLFLKLREKIGDVGAALVAAFGVGLVLKFRAVTGAIWGMVRAMTAARAASAMSAGLGGALNPVGTPLGAAASRGAGAGAGAGMGVLGAVSLPFLAAMVVDSMIPRDQKIDSALGDWDTMRAMVRGESLGKLGGPITNNSTTTINQSPVINFNGVKLENVGDVQVAITEVLERERRHLAVALSGSRR